MLCGDHIRVTLLTVGLVAGEADDRRARCAAEERARQRSQRDSRLRRMT